jgi:hypothetical protein
MRTPFLLFPWFGLFAVAGLLLALGRLPSLPLFIVEDDRGPVADAEVRFKGQTVCTRTDAQGRFALPWSADGVQRITATKPGYFINGTPANRNGLRLFLERLPSSDNEEYAWVDSTPAADAPHNCGTCHGEIYNEWSASGHAQSVTNKRFLNLYDGSDWQGHPGVGWGLLIDHPDGAAVCASCHAPTVRSSDPAFYDLRQARGVDRQGVHCDYCHKVAGPGKGEVGKTHGRFGLELLRPTEGQLFFGPLPDVDRGEDVYAPFYQESRYCASCHEGVVFGAPVYTTYSEYLQSPARRAGQQCQTCHMAPTGTMTNLASGHGGMRRDPQTLGNHRFFVGSQEEMLRRCLSVSGRLTRQADGLRVEVEVKAEGVGHWVPTGFVDRNLVLLVEGLRNGKTVAARQGSMLPEMAGDGFAGRSGRLYAKVLKDFDGLKPAPFWRADSDAEDSRLRPGEADRSVYLFATDVERVRYRLVYRRFWPEVTRIKGWPDDRIVVKTGEWE